MKSAGLIYEASVYLQMVKQFYDCNKAINDIFINNILMIEWLKSELEDISKHPDNEIPCSIISLRRQLVAILPHYGYAERCELNEKLNSLLEECRKLIFSQNQMLT